MIDYRKYPGPARDLSAVPAGLVDLTKHAAVSLTKHGLDGQRASVYLVIDRSGSMSSYYANGSVQHLAEQALGLSAVLDDDGRVPLVFFDHRVLPIREASLTDYVGIIQTSHQALGGQPTMGGTRYSGVMQAVANHWAGAGSNTPALVIFQTDGQPSDDLQAESVLRELSGKPLFWSFIGFGPKPVPFLQGLDTMAGRVIDNASYFHAGPAPLHIPDAQLYDGITSQYGPWLTAAGAAGILP